MSDLSLGLPPRHGIPARPSSSAASMRATPSGQDDPATLVVPSQPRAVLAPPPLLGRWWDAALVLLAAGLILVAGGMLFAPRPQPRESQLNLSPSHTIAPSVLPSPSAP